jgi:hypothetical protein
LESDSNLYVERKTLAKLNRLERFLLKAPAPNNQRPKKESSNITWNFSPTKAEYKLENETLKIVQDHLRIRLDTTTSNQSAGDLQLVTMKE